MRHYEIVVMASAEQFDRGTAMAERYRGMIADGGGSVHRFEDWGSRRLAYPIAKRQRARYFLFNIECDAETLAKLKDDFRYSESVVRSLVIRREAAVTDESPILTHLKKVREAEAAEAARAASVAAAAEKAVAEGDGKDGKKGRDRKPRGKGEGDKPAKGAGEKTDKASAKTAGDKPGKANSEKSAEKAGKGEGKKASAGAKTEKVAEKAAEKAAATGEAVAPKDDKPADAAKDEKPVAAASDKPAADKESGESTADANTQVEQENTDEAKK